MRRLLLPLVALMASALQAQDLAWRDSLIRVLYKQERYADLAKAIELQVEQAQGTPWQDSLHRYVYKYGRAMRKIKGGDGAAAAESLVERVRKRGKAPYLLEALFDLSWIYYEAGRTTDYVRSDSMAVVVAQSDPAIPRAQRGRACQYLAFDYSILGDHRNSARYAQMALDEYAKADSVPAIQWAESYNAVGAALWHLGRLQESETQYDRALEALKNDTSEAAMNRRVSTFGNLGVLWQDGGDLARSKSFYNRSIHLCDRIIASTTDPSTRDEAIISRSRSYLNLATVYYELGDMGRSSALLEQVWRDRATILAPDDPQLLAVRERQGDVAMTAGDLDQAAALFRSYLTACEAKYGTRSAEYARAARKLGEVAMEQGRPGSADSLFTLSIASSRATDYTTTSVELVKAFAAKASLHAAAGNHAQAIADLEQARAIEVNVYGRMNYRVARLDLLLAEQAFAMGHYREAAAHADSAMAMLKVRVDAMRASRLPLLYSDPHLLPDAVYWKVRAGQALDPGAESGAWNADIDMAINYLMRSQANVEDDASKLLLMAAQQRLFSLALETTYADYSRSRSEQGLQRFFNLTETNRSVLLKNRLNAFAGLNFNGVPDSLIALEQELRAGLQEDMDDPAAIADRIAREAQFRQLLQLFERKYPRYYELRYGQHVPSLAEVRQRLLTPDRQLLVYARTKDHLFAVVIGRDSSSITQLDAHDLGTLTHGLNRSIALRRTMEFTDQAYRLYQQVFAPVADRLTADELLIVPDGELRTVNFELLLTDPGVADYTDHLLIQRHTIAYLLSATTAIQFAGIARERSKGLLALAPGFSDQVKAEYRSSVTDTSELDNRFFRFVRQPFAVRTAQALGHAPSAQVLTGQAASEGRFRQEAGKYGVLYLGTHAEMDPSYPMYSRLVLSKGGAGTKPDDDGYLHAYEIYELDLRAQLAVLTACESGAGKEEAGEGIRSLGASFAYAGCPSLVVALWNIDEKVSAGIITHFHELLAAGMPKHKALRQAKLDFLATAKDELVHPYYWAGLVLIGDVGPVVQDRSWVRFWWIPAVLLLVAILLWWSRRTRALGTHSGMDRGSNSSDPGGGTIKVN
jgi:CHAT domain-containing protein